MQKYIVLLIIIWFVFLLSQIPTDNSYANDLVFEHIMYTSTESICNSHFIGEDWEESMKYEWICSEMWTEWTKEINSSYNL